MTKKNTYIIVIACALLMVPVHGMQMQNLTTRISSLAKKLSSPLMSLQRIYTRATECRYIPPFESQRHEFYRTLITKKPWGAVAEKHIKKLALKEWHILQDLLRINGVSHNDFERLKLSKKRDFCLMEQSDCYDFYSTLAWKMCTKKIHELLTQHNINPHTLTLQKIIGSYNPEICVAQNVFMVNSEFIEKYSNNHVMFNAVVCHEIQHLLHDDCYIRDVMRSMLHYTFKNKQDTKLYLAAFSRFQEERADTMAALTSPRRALGLIDFFSLHKDNPHNIMHPLNSERVAYIKKLHQEMLETVKKA